MTLVKRLNKELERKNISKLELAKLSGVKRSTVYNVFNEAYDAKLDTLRPIARVLDVSLDYLITGKDAPTAPQTAEKPYAMELYEALSEDAKAVLLQSIEMMYKIEYGELPKPVKHLVLTKFDK